MNEQRLLRIFIISSIFFTFCFWSLFSSLLVLSLWYSHISFEVLFARDGIIPTSHQHEDLLRELYETLLCICYGQVAKVTTDPDSKRQRAFVHEFLGFLASGSWGFFVSFFFPLFVFLFPFGSVYIFPLPCSNPQEGKLLKSHGSLGMWINSILW